MSKAVITKQWGLALAASDCALHHQTPLGYQDQDSIGHSWAQNSEHLPLFHTVLSFCGTEAVWRSSEPLGEGSSTNKKQRQTEEKTPKHTQCANASANFVTQWKFLPGCTGHSSRSKTHTCCKHIYSHRGFLQWTPQLSQLQEKTRNALSSGHGQVKGSWLRKLVLVPLWIPETSEPAKLPQAIWKYKPWASPLCSMPPSGCVIHF